MSLIGLLVAVLVVCVIMYAVYWVVGWMELPEPFRKIVLLIVGVICILILLSQLGAFGRPVVVW